MRCYKFICIYNSSKTKRASSFENPNQDSTGSRLLSMPVEGFGRQQANMLLVSRPKLPTYYLWRKCSKGILNGSSARVVPTKGTSTCGYPTRWLLHKMQGLRSTRMVGAFVTGRFVLLRSSPMSASVGTSSRTPAIESWGEWMDKSISEMHCCK